MKKSLLVIVASVQLLLVTAAQATAYAPNFVWQRWVDWTPGTVPGTSIGNPDADQAGSPVWRVGYLTGGGLASADPWYSNSLQRAVWDDAWWGSNVGGVWARDYLGPDVQNNIGANPPIDRYTIWHDLTAHTHSYQYASAVDWVNPVGDGAVLNMSGSFRFLWEGHFSTGSPAAPVESVLAKFDASSGTFTPLWSGSFTNPTVGDALSAASTFTAPITLLGVRMDAGDYLRFSFRSTADESATPLWIGMRDGMYMRLVAVVPEPASALLLGLGGLALAGLHVRRKRPSLLLA